MKAAGAEGWILIGHVAVKTTSVMQAARVAAKVKTTRQKGRRLGIEFMCLSLWREKYEKTNQPHSTH